MSMNDTIKRKFVLDLKKAPDKPADLTKTRRHALLSNALPHPYDATKLKEGAIADTLKNVVLGAVFGVKHGPAAHPKKDLKKAETELSKPAAKPVPAKKERIEPTFDAGPPKSDPPPADAGSPTHSPTLHTDIAKKFTKPDPVPDTKTVAPLTLDPKAQKADEIRRKAAHKTHTDYVSALHSASSTNSPESRASYLNMAHAHAEKMRKHDVHVDVNDDLAKLDQARKAKLRKPSGNPPPVSA